MTKIYSSYRFFYGKCLHYNRFYTEGFQVLKSLNVYENIKILLGQARQENAVQNCIESSLHEIARCKSFRMSVFASKFKTENFTNCCHILAFNGTGIKMTGGLKPVLFARSLTIVFWSTYQICRICRTWNWSTTFHKWICNLTPEARVLFKVL